MLYAEEEGGNARSTRTHGGIFSEEERPGVAMETPAECQGHPYVIALEPMMEGKINE